MITPELVRETLPATTMEAGLASAIALTILEGFEKHITLYQEITAGARQRFEAADWDAVHRASRERIYYYDLRVKETLEQLRNRFGTSLTDDENIWHRIKIHYIHQLLDHKQPELAETYYNSVFCHLFDSDYYSNENIFMRSSVSTENLYSDPPAYRCYYPGQHGLRSTFKSILTSFGFEKPFEDLNRDLRNIFNFLRKRLPLEARKQHLNFHISVLTPLFYRSKAAYIIGKATVGFETIPFIIPLLNNDKGEIFVDTVLLDESELSGVFSFSRAYFMVDHPVPSAIVDFLIDIIPRKSRADLYSAIGFHKQGKTVFYRDFLHHIKLSDDQLIIAPGIPGMVMMVFLLPSYPYVFKVIRDHFAPPKEVDRETVLEKYQLVKQHDRVGRMADTMEYSGVAFPLHRFSPELLEELKRSCANSIEIKGNRVIIKHLYIERYMKPLNIFIAEADKEQLENAIYGYGQAIRQMAGVNIFPGDMLHKNFGVTRSGRVVFYDYDEVCYLTECRIRRIPPTRNSMDDMSSQPWYSVEKNDVFPEEFQPYFLSTPEVSKVFMKYHADLMEPSFWKQMQKDVKDGLYQDIYPYRESKRFNRDHTE